MQELTVPPQNVSPYTPAGGNNVQEGTPRLGAPLPGTTSGLPAQAGLSVANNPMPQAFQSNPNYPPAPQQGGQQQQQAQAPQPMQSNFPTPGSYVAEKTRGYGRGKDTMLVHMTPEEVSDLQTLAIYHGTTMTINPETGLPEAGLLGKVFKKLIPTLLGAALAATGVGAPLAAGIVGLGSTALTGSLKKGLMAGLGAFGGASLAGAAGLGGSISKNAFGVLGDKAGFFGANMGAGALSGANGVLATSGGAGTGVSAAENAWLTSQGGNFVPAVGTAGTTGLTAAGPSITGAERAFLTQAGGKFVPEAAKTGLAGFGERFGQAARAGLPGGFIGKMAPGLAVTGLLGAASGVDEAIQTSKGSEQTKEEDKWKYEGPYQYVPKVLDPQATGPGGMGEILFFQPRKGRLPYTTAMGTQPANPWNPMAPRGFASGGQAKPVDQREYMHEYAGDDAALRLMTEGVVGPNGQRTQFDGTEAAMRKPGYTTDIGGVTLQLGDDYRWRMAPPTTPTPTPTATPTTIGATTATPINIPATAASPVTLPPTTTPPVTTPPGSPPPGTYTPQFTQLPNKTYQAPARTDGTQALNALPGLVNMFNTSPGAITANPGYSGGSPVDRIKADLAARAAQRAALEQATMAPAAPAPMAPQFSSPAINTGFAGFQGFGYGDDENIAPGDRSYAKGGIYMDDGAFVVDARTVSELGNGSSSAGQELLARLGGRPVKGPGDGVSDSIRANIGGTQEARVARDEVIIPAAQVKRLGGAKKLYAMMAKAEKARKTAKRGQDTGLRKGLV